MNIKHKILISAHLRHSVTYRVLLQCTSPSDGVHYKHRFTYYSPHYNTTCSLQAHYKPDDYSLSYCHFCLAVSDKVWLWRHVASGVQLLFCDAEFLGAVALSES